MKILVRLRHLCWYQSPEMKKASRSLLFPEWGAAYEKWDGLNSRAKTGLLSMDLTRLLALLLICGCGKSPPPQPKTSPQEQGHTHSESGEHHSHEEEHGILRHKPRTFTEAVIQIDTRGHALLSHHHGHHITEWFEILGWLPEIAADTDLEKSDWDSVVRIGRDLETWSAGWKNGDKSSPNPVRLDELVAELKALVAKLPVRG
jgi:hypothetical protein